MKRAIHLYLEDEIDANCTLPFTIAVPREKNHLLNVMRLREGQGLLAHDPNGRIYEARLRITRKREAMLELLARREEALDASGARITVYQAPPKASHLDEMIRPLSELGVWNLTPFLTERTLWKKSSDGLEKRLGRWRRMARESAKQCQRETPMAVGEVLTFEKALADIPHFAQAFWLTPESAFFPSDLTAALPREKAPSLLLFVGPEGGFSPRETKALTEAGAKPLCIHRQTLRSETAALVAVSILSFLLSSLEAVVESSAP